MRRIRFKKLRIPREARGVNEAYEVGPGEWLGKTYQCYLFHVEDITCESALKVIHVYKPNIRYMGSGAFTRVSGWYIVGLRREETKPFRKARKVRPTFETYQTFTKHASKDFDPRSIFPQQGFKAEFERANWKMRGVNLSEDLGIM